MPGSAALMRSNRSAVPPGASQQLQRNLQYAADLERMRPPPHLSGLRPLPRTNHQIAGVPKSQKQKCVRHALAMRFTAHGLSRCSTPYSPYPYASWQLCSHPTTDLTDYTCIPTQWQCPQSLSLSACLSACLQVQMPSTPWLHSSHFHIFSCPPPRRLDGPILRWTHQVICTV